MQCGSLPAQIKAESARAFPQPSYFQGVHPEPGSWISSWVCQFGCDYRTAPVPVTIPSRQQKIITDSFTNEAPKHTISGAGRHLWKLSSPAPLLKAGSARPGCLEHCPVVFWTSPRMETPQPVWVTCATVWPCSKKGFLYLCLLPLIFSLGITEKSVASSSLLLLPGTYTFWDVALSLPFYRLNSSSSLTLSLYIES